MKLHIAIPAFDELDFLPHTLAAITQQKCYTDIEEQQKCPIAEEIANEVVSLPMYYGMTEEDINRVIDVINKY